MKTNEELLNIFMQYGKENGISYNGLKKQNKAVKILNNKYIIDND